MSDLDYWEECIGQAADDIELTLTAEQIKHLAEAVSGGHENYNQAFGYDMIPCPVESQATRELEQLKREKKEQEAWIRSTIPCRYCVDGWGVDSWGRNCSCSYCYGKGRVRA